ncbi:MAG: hypothetical protein RLZZ15_269 [Verrucomicrobiota bacterium]|jgi:hypothetical protein
MMKTSARIVILAALLGAAATAPALASGSYGSRPPKPPTTAGGAMKMDQEKYGLGQKVYEGSAMTPGGGNADAQRARLQSAQAMLPADAMKAKDLPALAGKLSAVQLEALEYFVAQRFGMKK